MTTRPGVNAPFGPADRSTVNLLSTIERRGWQTERLPQGWRAYHPAADRDVFMSVTPSWMSLQMLVPPNDNVDQVQHYRNLLQRTEMMFMAKYCRDHAGIITLQVDLPNATSLIDYALDAIVHYGAHDSTNPVAADDMLDRTTQERYFEQAPGIPPEVIAYYMRSVEAAGWGVHRQPKGITWRLSYKGHRLFEVYLTITRSWSYFQLSILPAPPKSTDPGEQAALFEYMLGVNQVLYLAKLGLNDAGQIVLMADLPTQELDFDRFRLITRLLAQYVDLYAREIQIMAHLSTDTKLKRYLNVS